MRIKSILLALILLIPSTVALAQEDVGTTIESFFSSTEAIFMSIAGFMVVIAFFGLAFMYLGSALPIIGDWKKENPKAARDVIIGLVLLIFISGGTLGSLVVF